MHLFVHFIFVHWKKKWIWKTNNLIFKKYFMYIFCPAEFILILIAAMIYDEFNVQIIMKLRWHDEKH